MKDKRIERILRRSTGVDETVAERVTLAILDELAAPSVEMIAAGCATASRRLIDIDRQDIEEVWRAMTNAAVGNSEAV